jgi:small subunit ribosomal protein S5
MVNNSNPAIKNNNTGAGRSAGAVGGARSGQSNFGANRSEGRSQFGGKGKRRPGDNQRAERDEEFEQRIVDLARVTRVMAGGKRMRFRACVALGNKKGKVGIGLAKGADVTLAVTKAVNNAKKNMIDVPIVNETIPHAILHKYGAAKIIFKPAKKGRGVIAGGTVRIVLELAGIKNITSKILGTNNKVNNAKCIIEALRRLKKIEPKKDDSQKKENDAKTKEGN